MTKSAADPRGAAPVASPPRRSRRLAAPSSAPTNPLLEQAFPSWTRPPKQPAVGADAGFEAAFFAGASLALLDQILRPDPPFAGALRQRLALRAATACAALARHREDSSALRDAEHLSPDAGGKRPPARPGASIGCGAVSPGARRGSKPNLRPAADLLDLPRDLDFRGARRDAAELIANAGSPLAAAARASAAALQALDGAPRVDAEILALWLGDLVLARKLGWRRPLRCWRRRSPIRRRVAAQAASVRVPADADWVDAAAGAYATAAEEACVLAGELSRRGEKLLAAQPKLRAKSAGRVIELLLSRRRGVAGARREGRASIRSRRPPLVRSADRAWRRARTLRPPEFSALWTVAFSREVGTGSREKRVKKGM